MKPGRLVETYKFWDVTALWAAAVPDAPPVLVWFAEDEREGGT